jgi:hypothetical protein
MSKLLGTGRSACSAHAACGCTCCLRLAAHNHLALCPIQNQRAARELMQVHEAAHASASKKESALKEQVDDLQHQLHQGTAT